MNKIILLIILGLFVACSGEDNGHAHEHEEGGMEALAYTLYSDKTEIFVEFQPLIVGVNAKFAAHFTILGEYFKPLEEGVVTVSLIVNGQGIKQTATAPATPGIYRLSLQPKVAGKGDLIFEIQTKDFTDRQIIKDVTIHPNEQTALNDQQDDAGGGDISYLKEQAWKVEFANAPVVKQPFHNIIKTSGKILSAPGDEILITAKAGGIVRFSGNKLMIGSVVSTGTPLFTITGGNLAQGNLDAAVKEAKANFEKAKADYERSKDLVNDKIISERDFQKDKLAFENAQTAFNMISKGYSGNGQIITAPLNGFIKNTLVSEGEYVSAGTPLATVSKNSKLILQANVSQKYFDLLPSITSANFKTASSEEFLSTENTNGKVVSYGKSVNPGSPFIPLNFEIDNTVGIIPGSIVEVFLKLKELNDALVIPVSALIEEQGSFFVYVQTEGESFQKREVKLGASDGINVQAISGIFEGERVVTKGAYQIKLATATGTLPAHGHEH